MAKRGKLKSQQDLGVQMNRLYSGANGNPARQQRILSSFNKMNGRMGRMTDGQAGGSARKFSTTQRMGLNNG